jgi:hypothetical protein
VSEQTLATQIRNETPEDMGLHYESPLTQAEILYAITLGGQKRTPGRDGLGLGFYKAT